LVHWKLVGDYRDQRKKSVSAKAVRSSFFRLDACHERLNLLAVEHGRQKTFVLETTLQKDGRFLGVQSGAVEYIQLKLLFLP
jgi:hypothetical protein